MSPRFSNKKRSANSRKSSSKGLEQQFRPKHFSCGHLFLLLVGYSFFIFVFIHFAVIPGYTVSQRLINYFGNYFPSSLWWVYLFAGLQSTWNWSFFTLSKYSTYRYDIPVYYINLEVETQRNQYIEKHLKETGFQRIHRINAWTVDDVKERVRQRVTSTKTMLNPNEREIGCIASHLYAMYVAVHDPTNSNPYALIVEDDVSIPFAIDWSLMVEAAPKEFGILQLTTSHSAEMRRLWEEYSSMSKEKMESAAAASTTATGSATDGATAVEEGEVERNVWNTLPLAKLLAKHDQLLVDRVHKDTSSASTGTEKEKDTKTTIPEPPDNTHAGMQSEQMLQQIEASIPYQLTQYQWVLRSNTSMFWSTQGYIIQKAIIQPWIDRLIEEIYFPVYHAKMPIITLLPYPHFVCPPIPYQTNKKIVPPPCALPVERIVADVYLYSMFQPTYMSRIPLLNGAMTHREIAESSSIQSTVKAKAYWTECEAVERVIESIRVNGSIYTTSSMVQIPHSTTGTVTSTSTKNSLRTRNDVTAVAGATRSFLDISGQQRTAERTEGVIPAHSIVLPSYFQSLRSPSTKSPPQHQ